MFTIIGSDGKEYGPVSSEQLRQWMADGRADARTKIRRDASAEWQVLGELPEFSAQAATPRPTPQAPAGPIDPVLYAADLVARAPKIDIMEVIKGAWELLKAHLWPLVGGTAVVLLVQAGINLLPMVGPFGGFLLGGVLMGGLYLYYLRFLRGETPALGDVFAGFTLALVPLMLGGVVTSLLTGVGILLLVLPGIYLAVAWSFTSMLIIDQKLDFWTAMEVSRRVITAQWWQMFGLILLTALIAVLGVLVVFVGIFFTLPIALGSLAIAYESLCRPPPRNG